MRHTDDASVKVESNVVKAEMFVAAMFSFRVH